MLMSEKTKNENWSVLTQDLFGPTCYYSQTQHKAKDNYGILKFQYLKTDFT